MTKQAELKVWLGLLTGSVVLVMITGSPYFTNYSPAQSSSTHSVATNPVPLALAQAASPSLDRQRQEEDLEQVAQQRLEQVTRQYALNAAQQQQLRDLQNNVMPEMRQIVLNPALSRAQKRAQILALRAQMHDQVQQVIEPQKQ